MKVQWMDFYGLGIVEMSSQVILLEVGVSALMLVFVRGGLQQVLEWCLPNVNIDPVATDTRKLTFVNIHVLFARNSRICGFT